MSESSVVSIRSPESPRDALTEVLRTGAQQLLAEAVEAEVEAFLSEFGELRDAENRQRVVRNGHLPEREIQSGVGAVRVRVPRVRDRGDATESGEPIRFRSSLVPPYLRRTKSVEELLPWLYLKGISTGDFSEALSALLGADAPGLSPTTISRLKQGWTQEYEAWRLRDLSGKRYVYLWADGIYCNVRFDDARLCLLLLIGATEHAMERGADVLTPTYPADALRCSFSLSIVSSASCSFPLAISRRTSSPRSDASDTWASARPISDLAIPRSAFSLIDLSQ